MNDQTELTETNTKDTNSNSKNRNDPTTTSTSCQFRQYPPHRYYLLSKSEQPLFLTQNTEYLYGEGPFVLSSPTADHHHSQPTKFCVNQTEWLPPDTDRRLPFADGTNPSIVALSRLEDSLQSTFRKLHSNPTYLATLCMTNSQCQWNDSPEQIESYHLSVDSGPATVRTLLLLLDDRFQILVQTSLYIEFDSAWGRRVKRAKPDEHDKGKFQRELRDFDDARLFLNHHNDPEQQQLWISYREGKGFGWDKQVLNPVHFEFDNPNNGHFRAFVKSSESQTLCCGRNMALLQRKETGALQALTWVDPVTVINVSMTNTAAKRRRLVEEMELAKKVESEKIFAPSSKNDHRRRLAQSKPKKSHIHGTNAFMVPFGPDELLGIAHFHRPSDREVNPYARHGHHYTHAFFTINRLDQNYRLVRLSPEFVLPSYHNPRDAEIIQFLSGLEVLEESQEVVVAYGINDCEGAVLTFDQSQVASMLRDVPEGTQVVDHMAPLKSTNI